MYDENRTSLATYPDSAVIKKYKDIMLEMLHLSFPLLSKSELSAAIDHSISNHIKNTTISVNNNYKNIEIHNMTLLEMADYIIKREPILTSYGVLFNKHGTMPNPIYDMIDGFISARKAVKDEMFKYPKGSEDYEKYNLLQLLLKLDANGYYGITGLHTCIYYNIYAAATTTSQGRSCNSAAALFFESFLNNNVPMGSMNELIEFIHNIINESHSYDYYDIVKCTISVEECFYQLVKSTGFGWIPSNDEMNIIWEILSKLSEEELGRIYYKNNLFTFVENPPVKQAILFILQQLEAPFMDPNEPPEEISEALKELTNLFKEFVYYDKQIIDRIEKMTTLIRSVSIIQDTDSAIVSFDGWYRYIRQMCSGVYMKIKTVNTDVADFMDGTMTTSDTIRSVEDYSFIDDEIIEVDRLIDPMVIIPQDGLRYSIINILAYCIGVLVNDYMEKYCENSNSSNKRECLIVLKNEFLFKRVLITDAKKHYASKVEIQEGKIIPEEKSLDIKGMDAFIKSSTNPSIQQKLKKILYEDILNSENIDPLLILKDIAKIEKDIFTSISNGEKLFFKPVKVKAMASYENPMRIQGISSSYAYNKLHQPGTEALDLSIRNSIDVVKVDMNPKNISKIKDSFPDVYQKALDLFSTKEYSNGITSIAIPLNEPVPGWVLPFIEYKTIINDNMSGFPLESIGVLRGAKTNNSMNIIKF